MQPGVGDGIVRGVTVGTSVAVGVSVGFGLRPHADKARLNDVMLLNLRKSRREKFFDLLFPMARSLDRAVERLA